MNTKIKFSKMHGLGNDFVVINAISQHVKIDTDLARKIAHRNFGIGCDQVLLVEPPIRPNDDFYYRIFNANGLEAAQCGNGARCIGRFIRDEGLSSKTELQIGYQGGQMKVIIAADNQVTALLGPPSFEPQSIPIKALQQNHKHRYLLNIGQEKKEVTALSLGNPHCVFSVPSIRDAKVNEIGKLLQKNAAFPKGVNVGFMQILARNHIKLRVYERGVGETLACGTGAAAAVIAGIKNGELSRDVKVDMRGGHVFIAWPDLEGPVMLTGDTKRVFNGTFRVKAASTKDL